MAAEVPLAIGVITTPASVAQRVADTMVGAGVLSILNFAPCVVEVPSEVHLRYVDLSIELQVMSFYQSRREDRCAEGIMPAIRSDRCLDAGARTEGPGGPASADDPVDGPRMAWRSGAAMLVGPAYPTGCRPKASSIGGASDRIPDPDRGCERVEHEASHDGAQGVPACR